MRSITFMHACRSASRTSLRALPAWSMSASATRSRSRSLQPLTQRRSSSAAPRSAALSTLGSVSLADTSSSSMRATAHGLTPLTAPAVLACAAAVPEPPPPLVTSVPMAMTAAGWGACGAISASISWTACRRTAAHGASRPALPCRCRWACASMRRAVYTKPRRSSSRASKCCSAEDAAHPHVLAGLNAHGLR